MKVFKRILKCVVAFLLFLHDNKSGKPGNADKDAEN